MSNRINDLYVRTCTRWSGPLLYELIGVQANTGCHSPTDGVSQLGCSIVRNPHSPFCANGSAAPLLCTWVDRTIPRGSVRMETSGWRYRVIV